MQLLHVLHILHVDEKMRLMWFYELPFLIRAALYCLAVIVVVGFFASLAAVTLSAVRVYNVWAIQRAKQKEAREKLKAIREEASELQRKDDLRRKVRNV